MPVCACCVCARQYVMRACGVLRHLAPHGPLPCPPRLLRSMPVLLLLSSSSLSCAPPPTPLQDSGKIKLSRKSVLQADGVPAPPPSAADSGGDSGGSSPRGGGRGAPKAAPEEGKIYRGCRITQIMPFGAFVEVLPRVEGLVHVSEWSAAFTRNIADDAAIGDTVDVLVLEAPQGGKMRLSRKAVAAAEASAAAAGIPADGGGGAKGGVAAAVTGSDSDKENEDPVEVAV